MLATKGRFPSGADPTDRNGAGLSARHLRRALDDSLGRLDRDHVDLYQLHAFDALTPMDEILHFVDDARGPGRSATGGCPTSPAGS